MYFLDIINIKKNNNLKQFSIICTRTVGHSKFKSFHQILSSSLQMQLQRMAVQYLTHENPKSTHRPLVFLMALAMCNTVNKAFRNPDTLKKQS